MKWQKEDVWRRNAYGSVMTRLWICGALTRAVRILSVVEVDEADLGRACIRARVSENVEAQWLHGCSAGCRGRVTSSPVWVSSAVVDRLCVGSVSPVRSKPRRHSLSRHIPAPGKWCARNTTGLTMPATQPPVSSLQRLTQSLPLSTRWGTELGRATLQQFSRKFHNHFAQYKIIITNKQSLSIVSTSIN